MGFSFLLMRKDQSSFLTHLYLEYQTFLFYTKMSLTNLFTSRAFVREWICLQRSQFRADSWYALNRLSSAKISV
ncbi:hypothetical protein AEJ54_03150 [Azospirillum sp. Sp 7]|nr:hypothetical protein AEJ54_03150 [Azospirillum sp. Sp 7]